MVRGVSGTPSIGHTWCRETRDASYYSLYRIFLKFFFQFFFSQVAMKRRPLMTEYGPKILAISTAKGTFSFVYFFIALCTYFFCAFIFIYFLCLYVYAIFYSFIVIYFLQLYVFHSFVYIFFLCLYIYIAFIALYFFICIFASIFKGKF